MPAVRSPHLPLRKPRPGRPFPLLRPLPVLPLLIVPLLLLPLLLLLGGCEAQETPLQWQDLSPAEQTYVRRLVILERAKAVPAAVCSALTCCASWRRRRTP